LLSEELCPHLRAAEAADLKLNSIGQSTVHSQRPLRQASSGSSLPFTRTLRPTQSVHTWSPTRRRGRLEEQGQALQNQKTVLERLCVTIERADQVLELSSREKDNDCSWQSDLHFQGHWRAHIPDPNSPGIHARITSISIRHTATDMAGPTLLRLQHH
jgi:hypothetical protein